MISGQLGNWTDPEHALQASFTELDKWLCAPQQEFFECGAAANVCVIEPGATTVVCANLGDCRALSGSIEEGVFRQISTDHKPNLPRETERIRAAGQPIIARTGFLRNGQQVTVYRVGGSLALSRAFGDREFKAWLTSPPAHFAVTCVPETLSWPFVHNYYLLIGCDGIFDVLSNEEVNRLVYSGLQQARASLSGESGQRAALDAVACSVVEAALRAGSEDNCTAVLVFMK